MSPSSMISPEVIESRPARQCMSVDLPEPEGPMIAVNCPAPMSRSIPSSAEVSARLTAHASPPTAVATASAACASTSATVTVRGSPSTTSATCTGAPGAPRSRGGSSRFSCADSVAKMACAAASRS